MNQIEWMQRQIETLTKRVNDLSTLDKPNRLNAWQPIFQAASYVSATSILFTGADLTAYLTGYVKCRWYQSGWKYGYISASSLGSGNTTAVILGSTVLNAAITNFSISYGNPVDFPGFIDWTPTFGGFSSAPGGFHKYNISSGKLFFYIVETAGTSNNTIFTFTLPIAVAANNIVPARAFDNGLVINGPAILATGGTSTVSVYKDYAASGWTNAGNKYISSCVAFFAI